MENNTSAKSNWLYIGGLILVFVVSFSFTFDSKLDLNGDNCAYYMLSTSIVQGHGYSDISNDAYNPTNVFPPGYPLLMAPLRLFTDNIIAFKILNGLFLLSSVILFFFYMKKNKISDTLAFIASVAILLNYQILHFATMMMSEMAFLLTSVLAFWFISKLDDKKPFWKDPFLYLLILTVGYNHHIRTQGLALSAAIIGYFLLTKQWKRMAGFTGGFILCLFPWMIRNKMVGLEQSRYLDQVLMSNSWRPEAGSLDFGGLVSRFFETFQMLFTQAVPDSILPYIPCQYGTITGYSWLIAIIIWGFIGIGMWQFGKYKYLFILYALAILSIISIFSAPSENRYITTLLPYLEVSLLIGICTVLSAGVRKMKIAKGFSPWFFILLFLFGSYPRLQTLSAYNKSPYPSNYQNFFTIAKEVKKQLPPSTVVCSRKGELFYMFSQTATSGYSWTENDTLLIKGLVNSKTDYVILEQLGYSSTARYLYPAIQKNPELFPIIMHLPNPDTYLLKFEREKAAQKFQ